MVPSEPAPLPRNPVSGSMTTCCCSSCCCCCCGWTAPFASSDHPRERHALLSRPRWYGTFLPLPFGEKEKKKKKAAAAGRRMRTACDPRPRCRRSRSSTSRRRIPIQTTLSPLRVVASRGRRRHMGRPQSHPLESTYCLSPSCCCLGGGGMGAIHRRPRRSCVRGDGGWVTGSCSVRGPLCWPRFRRTPPLPLPRKKTAAPNHELRTGGFWIPWKCRGSKEKKIRKIIRVCAS